MERVESDDSDSSVDVDLEPTDKIVRLQLWGQADCRVIGVESPSIFWIRLNNHITDSFSKAIIRPAELEPLDKPIRECTWYYVLAPYKRNADDEVKYYRARVLPKPRNVSLDVCLVFYIDLGVRAWLKPSVLRRLDTHLNHKEVVALLHHPWQAVGCCLMKVSPRGGRKSHDDESSSSDENVKGDKKTREKLRWSDDVIAAFREIVLDKEVRIEVENGQRHKHNWALRVSMEIKDETSDEWRDVSTLLSMRCKQTLTRHRGIRRPSEQHVYETTHPNALERNPPTSDQDLEEWQRSIPRPRRLTNRRSVLPQIPKEVMIGANATPGSELQGFVVPEYSIEEIQTKFVDQRKQEMQIVVENCTVSPDEFYVHPLEVVGTDVNGDAIVMPADDFEQELQAFLHEVDCHYGDPRNRFPLDIGRAHALNQGYPVYAVAEHRGLQAEFTAKFQRVRLLMCHFGTGADVGNARGGQQYTQAHTQQQMSAEGLQVLIKVRFIDTGGTAIRLLADLFELTEGFADKPPYCLPCCMTSLQPALPAQSASTGAFGAHLVQKTEWTERANNKFRRLLRTDIPLSAVLFQTDLPCGSSSWSRVGGGGGGDALGGGLSKWGAEVNPRHLPNVIQLINVTSEEAQRKVSVHECMVNSGYAVEQTSELLG